jgi:hypothetical protein
MVARLVHIRHEKGALTRGVAPDDVPPARSPTRDGVPDGVPVLDGVPDGPAAPDGIPDGARAPDGRPRHRARHSARHARTSDPAAPQHTSLSLRSAERRRWSADLVQPDVTALVIHGLSGVGKSTLAAQIASRLSRLAPERVVTVVSGEVSEASLAAEPGETDLIVLNDFDDNLSCDGSQRIVRDPALAALLAGWAGKLLITCGTPFTLPEAQQEQRDRFVFRHLGPLTRSAAAELALSLPALRLLGEPERDLAWRLTAGHPLTMHYLDALLAAGVGLDDLADRITAAVQASTGQCPARTEPTELPEPTAEATALAAGQQLLGELFDRLSPGAQDLLVGASVFRTPVAPGVLAAGPADIAEGQAAGLLTPRPGHELSVHRWTAAELHRHLAAAGQTAQLAAAHRQAAGYWHACTTTPQLGPRAQAEAAYHLREAGDVAAEAAQAAETAEAAHGAEAPEAGEAAHAAEAAELADPAAQPAPPQAEPEPSPTRVGLDRRRLRRLGLASVAGVAAVLVAIEASNGFSASHLTSAERSDRPATPAPLTQADAVRGQAAAWVASQVSAAAIVACDLVMCSELVRHGFPAANLLVLGPGATDPLGSAVVLATSAVRALFGSRLVTVYAPQTLASFGTGEARIDVRAIAPDGAAAYRTALAADLRARQMAALQLLADPRLTVAAAARTELAAGQVDARLLITLAALAATEPVHIMAFGDAGPGADPGTPLRTAELAAPPATARVMLAFVRGQRPPYLPVGSGLSRGPAGQTLLSIQFAAPSPLGLLQDPP